LESVLYIVLALLTVGAADLGFDSGSPRPIAVAALILVPHAWALVARSAQYRGRFRLSALLQRTLLLLPFGLQVFAVTSLDWLGSVGTWTGVQPSLAEWPGLELLLGIAPYLAFHFAALHARTLLRDPTRCDRRALFLFQARMLLSSLAPFALYVCLSAFLGQSDELRVRLEEVSLYNTLFTLLLLGGFLGFMPFLLRNTWSTKPLPEGELRDLLKAVAAKSEFEFRELLLWNTGLQMANAAIVGFTRRTRVVLFTDALLQQLHPRELAAVFAHEMGHARRHHAVTFVIFVLIVFVGAQLLLDSVGVESEWLAMGIFGGLLVLWLLVFGFLSRRFELEADLNSLEALGDPIPLVSALFRVTGTQARDRDGWRHFSTSRRARFLISADKDPEIGVRLSRTLKRWSRGAAVLALALVALWALRLFELRPGEELLADLRLGQWERAAQRIEGGLEVDQNLERVIRRARALEPSMAAEELEDAALLAAQTGDIGAARDLLELAQLRGARELEVLLELLDELLLPVLERKLAIGAFEQLRVSLEEPWAQALVDPWVPNAQGKLNQGPGAILSR
jgi:Zn-dependent protease with chaperone function